MNLALLHPHTRQRTRIGPYIEGTLSPHDEARFSAHLSSCDGCRRQMETTRLVRAALQGLPDPAAPRSFKLSPAMLRDARVALPLTQARPRVRAAVGARFAAAAAAVALAAVVVIDVVPSGGGNGSNTAASAERDGERFSSTEKTAGGAAASEATTAATAAPRAASAPSADTGAISGAGTELAGSPTAAAIQDRTGDAVAEPTLAHPPDAFAVEVKVQDDGNGGGGWTRLRIVEVALAATLATALVAMVVVKGRQRRALP